MIDDGQAVDIKGISERSLVKHLKKLFLSLNLKEKGDGVFLLRSSASPTLELIGSLIQTPEERKEDPVDDPVAVQETPLDAAAAEHGQNTDDSNPAMPCPKDDSAGPKRR